MKIDSIQRIFAGTDLYCSGNIYGWTTLNVTEFTEEAILGELLARQAGIIYNLTGIDPAQIAGMTENLLFTLINHSFTNHRYPKAVLLVIAIVVFLERPPQVGTSSGPLLFQS